MTRACGVCGIALSGRRLRWCSDKCKWRSAPAQHDERRCVQCAAIFVSERSTMRYCSRACRVVAGAVVAKARCDADSNYRVVHAAQAKSWRARNPTRALDASRRYTNAHREEINERSARYHEATRQERGVRPMHVFRAEQAAQSLATSAGRREAQLARQREYYLEHRAEVAARYKRWREANLHLGRQKARRRRANERGVLIVRYSDQDICERDGWTCQLCLSPVDPRLPRTHRDGATIDHIVPISLGGADAPSNVQLAHMGCNSSKGARLASGLKGSVRVVAA